AELLSSSPMSVSLMFGSFGDIATLVQFVASVARTLSQSRGCSHQYQALITELDELKTTLKVAGDTVTPLVGNTACATAIATVRSEITKCAALVKQIAQNIAGYQKSLSAGGSGS